MKVLELVRLKPFDVSTEEGRSKERNRKLLFNVAAEGGAKGISILTNMISVPLTMHYLGVERYGLWMTVSSVVTMLTFADLGLGNGLLNAIAESHGKDDVKAARRYVSSALAMLGGIAVVLGLLFVGLYPKIPWASFFGVTTDQAVLEAGPAVAVLIGCFLLNMPLGVVQRIRVGYQQGFSNSLWMALGNVLGLAGVLLVISLQAGLPWLVLAVSGAPLVALGLNGIMLFGRSRPWLRPRVSEVRKGAAGRILSSGVQFFVLQLAMSAAFYSDNVVISRVLGASAVAEYAVPAKLFSMVSVVVVLLLSPLWPAYGEALARGDLPWIRRTLVRSVLAALVCAGSLSLLLVALRTPIFRLWIGAQAGPSFTLMLGFAAWTIATTVGSAASVFLNGTNALGFQLITAILMAAGAFALKVYMASTIGVSGVIWGTVLVYLVFTLIPMAFYVPWRLARMTPPTAV